MTEFRGRGDEVRVFPLSFVEFYSSNLWDDKYKAWNEYSRYGRFPMLLFKKTDVEKINDSFKKIIITQDLGETWRNDKGYLIINIVDFLLNPYSLHL